MQSGKRRQAEIVLRVSPVVAAAALLATSASAQVVRSGAGANAAAIQTVVDQFRGDLGPLNPNVPGSLGFGRREINWDGVPNNFSAPNNQPADFFNVNSPRGVVVATPGTGFQTSASAASGTAVEFGNLDPSYTGTFATFSAQRLFTAIDSNIVDVHFFVPGTNTVASVSGFGSVFSDVDLAGTTSLQFFGVDNSSLGTFFVPAGAGATSSETLSFVGVSFADSVIGRVRITNSNTALGAGVTDLDGNPRDLVVMDDFVYSEPRAVQEAAIPEVSTMVLGLAAVPFAGIVLRRRARPRRRSN